MALKKPRFVRKPYDKNLYKWSPQVTDKKANKKDRSQEAFCNATAGSQGEDFITTYVYKKVILKGIEHRQAYVACDYVS